MPRCCIVVPCYNEAARLPAQLFERFLERTPGVAILFVDDGSHDDTLALLRSIEQRHRDQVSVHALEHNGGKALAVWHGMRLALESDADLVGYWDADLATPFEAVPRFVEVLDADPSLAMVFGARVQLLGRVIERRPERHYLGRVFATLASNVLKLPIYDTQCGAKLFRASDLVRQLFREPFESSWIFDVELLARLVRMHRSGRAPDPRSLIYELPLDEWRDVPGSKVRLSDVPRAALELARIQRRYLRG